MIKMCPLLTIRDPEDKIETVCRGEKCAWWLGGDGPFKKTGCAIKVLATRKFV